MRYHSKWFLYLHIFHCFVNTRFICPSLYFTFSARWWNHIVYRELSITTWYFFFVTRAKSMLSIIITVFEKRFILRHINPVCFQRSTQVKREVLLRKYHYVLKTSQRLVEINLYYVVFQYQDSRTVTGFLKPRKNWQKNWYTFLGTAEYTEELSLLKWSDSTGIEKVFEKHQ